MRSRVARSGGARLRSAWTKCQKSAARPEMRVPARFDSSLATRNGDRALRPRSERSSTIDVTVDVKRDYTLRSSEDELGLCGIAAGVADGEAGSAEHEPEAHDVPEAERVTCRLEQR